MKTPETVLTSFFTDLLTSPKLNSDRIPSYEGKTSAILQSLFCKYSGPQFGMGLNYQYQKSDQFGVNGGFQFNFRFKFSELFALTVTAQRWLPTDYTFFHETGCGNCRSALHARKTNLYDFMMMKTNLLLLMLLAIGTVSGQYSDLPITLSLPYDQDSIDEKEPVFVWQSNLAAVQTDPRLIQRITVAEITGDQTPSEAIGLNVPAFIRSELVTNSITYSNSDQELKKNVWYAWQISYLFNGVVIQQSEVWKFILADELPVKLAYVALRRQSDGSVYEMTGKTLNVCTTEKGPLNLKAAIRTPDGVRHEVALTEMINDEPQKTTVSESSTETRYFTVDLTDLNVRKGISTFEWNGSRKQAYTLNFHVNK